MANKETLLQALIRPKLIELGGKLDFWKQKINVQEGEDWVTPTSLTLEKFLELRPCPASADEVTTYGIAWEFIWGEKPPEVVTKARGKLLEKAVGGGRLEPNEELWLKLIMVDTDLF
ncbi:MAG TPA: hypothetical protein VMR19_00150 [Candidatus Saccharimonadales bacterium]|jgi:hypothetical protein|nr:hypothetical protein [Candidatus Saccharimonadales bacterium]